jgi:hypothetical protein
VIIPYYDEYIHQNSPLIVLDEFHVSYSKSTDHIAAVATRSVAWVWPLGYWNRGFKSHSRDGYLSSSLCAVLSCGDRRLASF